MDLTLKNGGMGFGIGFFVRQESHVSAGLILLCKVDQNSTRLEDAHRSAALCVCVDYSRNLVVWADFQKLGLKLIATSNVDRMVLQILFQIFGI